MATVLEHDPHIKTQIKEAISAFIYDPMHRQLKSRIETLVRRNSVLGGHFHQHFVYKGVTYNFEGTPPPTKKNRLARQLQHEMDSLLQEYEQLKSYEMPFVMGFITQVLNASTSLLDYMRVLPEAVHFPLKQLLIPYPCRVTYLDENRVEHLRTKNQASIDLIKQRLVTNLLI